ncbi:hypothetical protein HDV04_005912 [Boothiomyces sp. JEL0838]|nr:hypothetical protein HDV04_005912 [Boothiomyces sp. JEL0838]
MWTLALLILNTSADLITEGQYYSIDCSGPVDVVYVFKTNHTFDYISWSPSLNETWPPYFKFHSTEASVGDTGSVYVPISGKNCISSTDFTNSAPYQSGYSLMYTGGYSLDTIPNASNGYSYCFLMSNNFNDPTILDGYKAAYFKQNDQACYDDHYKCSTNRVFSYFPGAGCSGSPESISLPSTLQQFNSSSLGSISVQTFQFQNASVYFSWSYYVPMQYVVPHFKSVSDIFALLVFLSCFIPPFYVLYETYKKIKSSGQYLFAHKVMIAEQVTYILYFLLFMIYWALLVKDVATDAVLSELAFVCAGIATLLSCLMTSFLISDIIFRDSKVLAQRVNAITLGFIHLLLYGSGYIEWIMEMGPGVYSNSVYNFVSTWSKFIIYWYLFIFTYNTVVPIVVAYRIKSSFSTTTSINDLDPKLKYYIPGQVMAFIMYAAVFYIKFSTSLLGNDLAFNNTIPYQCIPLAVLSLLNSKISRVISKASKGKHSLSIETGTKPQTQTVELEKRNR